jgi:hypothetical protein
MMLTGPKMIFSHFLFPIPFFVYMKIHVLRFQSIYVVLAGFYAHESCKWKRSSKFWNRMEKASFSLLVLNLVFVMCGSNS